MGNTRNSLAYTNKLLAIMAQLRDPESGCSWDRKQTYKTILPYTLEEAYEVADAIERNDMVDLKDELGDLLLQVVFLSQIATEAGEFTFEDVAKSIADKLTRRHPHVFGDERYPDEQAFKKAWEQAKQQERAAKSKDSATLSDIPACLPAMQKAFKIQKRVAALGFDWSAVSQVWAKVDEEIDELKSAIEEKDQDAINDEMGDLLFSLVNLARHLKVNPEVALRQANNKFSGRFGALEKQITQSGRDIEDHTLAELEAAWQAAKQLE